MPDPTTSSVCSHHRDNDRAIWLNHGEAAKHLRVALADVVSLVVGQRINAYRAIGSGLLFNRHELDAALLPVPSKEAAVVLAQSLQPLESITMTASTTTGGGPDDFMPLKDAAKVLGTFAYKTLLMLVNRGAIPAKNIGVHGKRPRWVVSLSQVKTALANQAEHETAQRRAPPQRINVDRFVRTGGRNA